MSGGATTDGQAALSGLLATGRALVVTGAGISTDSGIPDYRGPDGRMRHAKPMTFDRFRDRAEERRRYWARSHLGWPRVAEARPNAAHAALADLERAGLLAGVVTQNVDGLHAAAGSQRVIDLHGRLDRVVCLGCGRRRPRLELALRLEVVNPGFRQRVAAGGTLRPDGDLVLDEDVTRGFRPLDCRACGGVLKPDVVFFGEPVPRERALQARRWLDAASSLVVLGSSLMVGSAYRLVAAAKRRGLPVAIATRGVTRAEHLADVRLHAPLSQLMPDVADRLCGSQRPRDAVSAGQGPG